MIVVVADDMTGAAEIAGVCLRYGLRVAFATDVNTLPNENVTEVLVVATDTRSMELKDAVKETGEVLLKLREAGINTIFKKTDSVLRGHVLAELEVALEVFGKKRILLIPANPATGRTVVDGIYYVDGIPLDQTGFAADPDFPASFSEVEKLLVDRYHPDISVELGLSLTEVISVPDASGKEDLAKQAAQIGSDVLPAGSAAFFEAFLREEFPGYGRLFIKMKEFRGKSLIVCGSAHENSKKFVQYGIEKGVSHIGMPANLLQKEVSNAELEAWVEEMVSLLNTTNKLLVTVSSGPVKFEESSLILKERLAKAIKKVLDKVEINELFIEGGATAFSVVRATGFNTFIPANELKNGVVRMKVMEKNNCYMTFKPGSYAWPNYLLD